ncbi:MAG: TIR domain-containing protein [Polyangiaceae bacterium]|nr:TIR domain-containing protein [Polyangiaceae bacterium]
MAKLFVSYARKDWKLVAELCEGLRAPPHNHDLWVDTQSIPGGAQWRRAIADALVAAETVLIVLTERWLQSGYCRDEAEDASSLKKRIIPLRSSSARPPSSDDWLFELEWVELDEENLQCAIDRITRDVAVDFEWVQLHTSLYSRARSWEDHQEKPSYCLRGQELQDALHFLARSEAGKKPPAHDLHVRFVEASKREEGAELQRVRARELAARAELSRIQEPDRLARSLLLAVESARLQPSVLAQQTIRRGLSLWPRRVARHDVGPSTLLAMSADGSTLAIANDRELRWWRTPSSRGGTIPLGTRARLLALSEDGSHLAAAADGETCVWQTLSGEKLYTIDGHCTSLLFLSGNGLCALVREGDCFTAWRIYSEGSARESLCRIVSLNPLSLSPAGRYATDFYGAVWRLEGGEQVLEVKQPEAPWPAPRVSCHIHAFARSESSVAVVSSSAWAQIRYLDGPADQQIQWLQHHAGAVNDAAFSPDGRWLATAGDDGTARLWGSGSSRVLQHAHPVTRVAFSSDSAYVLTIAGDLARVWQVAEGFQVGQLPYDSEERFDQVHFMPNQPLLVTTDVAGVSLWSPTGEEPIEDLIHAAAVTSATFSRDGRLLCTTSGEEGSAAIGRVWTWQEGTREVASWDGLRHPTYAEFAPDGRFLATTDWYDNTMHLWHVAELVRGSGLVRAALATDHAATRVAFSADGRYLATIGAGRIKIWTMTDVLGSGEEAGQVSLEPAWEIQCAKVADAVFSPRGRYLIARGEDQTLYWWDVSTHEQVASLPCDHDIAALACSPTDAVIAVACVQGSVVIWPEEPAAAPKPVAELAHGEDVLGLDFDPQGKWLATGGTDSSARVWDWATGSELARMMHPHAVLDVAFCHRDDRRLATACRDGKARIWRWRIEDLLAEVSQRVARELTEAERGF